MGLELSRKGAVSTKKINEHILEGVFPIGEVHIVAGGSGAGKTTFILDLIDNWRQGKSWFGHKSSPRPFMYISGDRSEAGILRTFSRVGVNPDNFDILIPRGSENNLPLIDLMKQLHKQYPKTEVYWIEGFASKVPKGRINDYDTVAKFLKELQDWCETNRITIIGVCHSPKTKEDDGYEDPRHKVMGTMAWSAYSETIIIIEPIQASNPESKLRRLLILPRNYPAEVYKLTFSDGMLVPVTATEKVSNLSLVEAWLRAFGEGEEFSVADAEESTGVKGSSLRKELGVLLANGTLGKGTKKGWYVFKGFKKVEPLDITAVEEVRNDEEVED